MSKPRDDIHAHKNLSRIRDEMGAGAWPMAEPTRTLAQLRETASGARERRIRNEEQKRKAARRKLLSAMAADPQKVIANAEKLVTARSVGNYEKGGRRIGKPARGAGAGTRPGAGRRGEAAAREPAAPSPHRRAAETWSAGLMPAAGVLLEN